MSPTSPQPQRGRRCWRKIASRLRARIRKAERRAQKSSDPGAHRLSVDIRGFVVWFWTPKEDARHVMTGRWLRRHRGWE